jgi:hypothetical protein
VWNGIWSHCRSIIKVEKHSLRYPVVIYIGKHQDLYLLEMKTSASENLRVQGFFRNRNESVFPAMSVISPVYWTLLRLYVFTGSI